jgi:hypothetical protein
MPSKLRSQCLVFVDKYGSAIADIIVQEITPDNVCELLGLCAQTNKILVPEIKKVFYFNFSI